MTRITRKGATVRKAAAEDAKARARRAARARNGGVLDAAMAMVPLNEHQLHRVFLAIILGGAVALAWIVASLAGVPAMASEQVASVAIQAGFAVRRVEVRGTHHLNELRIYERVLAERDRAMPEVDLGALRASITDLSWVADARVSRQLPDTIVVDVVERQPHAVLRVQDDRGASHLALIDATGHTLEPITPGRAKAWLIMSGDGAVDRVADLDQLLDAAPALKPQVAEADWIGHRRWNLIFRTGQTLALPEGDDSADALISFARLDGTHRLLGGKAAAFDMRIPGRVFLRVPGRADAAAGHVAITAPDAALVASAAVAGVATLHGGDDAVATTGRATTGKATTENASKASVTRKASGDDGGKPHEPKSHETKAHETKAHEAKAHDAKAKDAKPHHASTASSDRAAKPHAHKAQASSARRDER